MPEWLDLYPTKKTFKAEHNFDTMFNFQLLELVWVHIYLNPSINLKEQKKPHTKKVKVPSIHNDAGMTTLSTAHTW